MIERQRGYWDVDRCAWVGADPAHAEPPAPVDTSVASDVAAPGLPEPRPAGDEPVTARVTQP
jgi:hypothetical protein